jgi:predicted NBD/HSP70 family sugar kinase
MTGSSDQRRTAATPRLLRHLNADLVLDALRGADALSVTELASRTELSRPTVDAVVDDLARLGWIGEVAELEEARRSQRGRPPRRLRYRADAGYVAAVDIGEHKVRAAVADLRGEIVAERLTDNLFQLDGRARLAAVRRAARQTLKAAGLPAGTLLGATVGCTGGIDDDSNVLFTSAFPGLERVNLKRELGRVFDCEVLVENDCNLAAIAERWKGIAQGVDDVICVLAAERLGAGIVLEGRLIRGHAGLAGEMPFLGAYEEESGAEGIADLVRRFTGEEPEAVFEAAQRGDSIAQQAIERSARAAGRAIVTMALLLNPEVVVISGGVAAAGETLVAPLRRQLEQSVRMPPRLEASPLAARGPLIGAIRHALDAVETRLLDGLAQTA